MKIRSDRSDKEAWRPSSSTQICSLVNYRRIILTNSGNIRENLRFDREFGASSDDHQTYFDYLGENNIYTQGVFLSGFIHVLTKISNNDLVDEASNKDREKQKSHRSRESLVAQYILKIVIVEFQTTDEKLTSCDRTILLASSHLASMRTSFRKRSKTSRLVKVRNDTSDVSQQPRTISNNAAQRDLTSSSCRGKKITKNWCCESSAGSHTCMMICPNTDPLFPWRRHLYFENRLCRNSSWRTSIESNLTATQRST